MSIYDCSLFVILYHLVVLVRVALEGTMVSTLLILSATKKRFCKEASSLNLGKGIHHGTNQS